MRRIMEQIWLAGLLIVATVASSQSPAQVVETPTPDLDALLQSVEHMQQQDAAQSQPYDITWKYKVFRGDSKQPMSEVTAQISFAPPDIRTYKITQTQGNMRGEKIVRTILDQQIEAAKKGNSSRISRRNYNFVFLRREDFGVPEYVLLIIPNRKAKNLLLGQIWVDANTFRIRRIEGVPIKSPSIWIKDIHVTVQCALLNGTWLPVSFDAIATVRFMGQYTLTGLTVGAPGLSAVAR